MASEHPTLDREDAGPIPAPATQPHRVDRRCPSLQGSPRATGLLLPLIAQKGGRQPCKNEPRPRVCRPVPSIELVLQIQGKVAPAKFALPRAVTTEGISF